MVKTWLISDTHFGHQNIYRFIDQDGNPIRRFTDPWYADNAEKGDELMIHWWRTLIKPEDKVYHLGDVAMGRKSLEVLETLPGRKVLISGNHDRWKAKDLISYFDDIKGSLKVGKFFLTHIPIHPDSIPHWADGVIHGHIHEKLVRIGNEPDVRYINVSVEQTGGKPIKLQDVIDGRFHPAKGIFL